MRKNRLHLVIDLLAYLAMVSMVSTGLTMWGLLPPGSGGRHGGGRGGGLTVLGYSRHEWGDVHWYLAVTLIVLVALHVILHWKWVTNSVGALLRGERKLGAGVAGTVLLAILGVVAVGAIATPWIVGTEGIADAEGPAGKGRSAPAAKASASEPDPDAHQEHGQGQAITGRTTLAEAAAEAGVTAERLAAELKLPASTPAAAQLGQLRRQHGFTIEDVRAVVARLKTEAGK